VNNRIVFRAPADLSLWSETAVPTDYPSGSGRDGSAHAGGSVSVLRMGKFGGSQRVDVGETRRAPMPQCDEARLASELRTLLSPSGYPTAAAIGGTSFDQFGSQHPGGNSSPCPLRRTSRQSSGTTPGAGVSPNPLPAHGETLDIGHYPRSRTHSFTGNGRQTLLPHLHLRSACR
jgi:hypothetical protein